MRKSFWNKAHRQFSWTIDIYLYILFVYKSGGISRFHGILLVIMIRSISSSGIQQSLNSREFRKKKRDFLSLSNHVNKIYLISILGILFSLFSFIQFVENSKHFLIEKMLLNDFTHFPSINLTDNFDGGTFLSNLRRNVL